MLIGDDGTVPKERYVSRAFLDLEMERLWPRVWQVACREEVHVTPWGKEQEFVYCYCRMLR